MSGGRFNYIQYRFKEIRDDIEQEIIDNDNEQKSEEFFEPNHYSNKTILEFKKGVEYIKKAEIYIHRIDWLLTGDDGEDNFHKRLMDDLSNVKEKE